MFLKSSFLLFRQGKQWTQKQRIHIHRSITRFAEKMFFRKATIVPWHILVAMLPYKSLRVTSYPIHTVRHVSGLSATLRNGDYAGYHATYNQDGRHMALPDHYVPPVLREWGQVPLALEVVVSENPDNNTRQILTVLPETGCGIDNLEVLKKREELGKLIWNMDGACVYVNYSPETSQTRMECILADENIRRSRIVLHCDDRLNVKKPISLFLERRISETSTEGRRADGGGLDARSVSEWIGSDLRSMESSWNKVYPSWLGTLTQNVQKAFGLPGNLTVAYHDSEKDHLTVWIGQAQKDQQQVRFIQVECHNSEWKAHSWIEDMHESSFS